MVQSVPASRCFTARTPKIKIGTNRRSGNPASFVRVSPLLADQRALGQACFDLDLGGERAVHRALVRNLEQTRTLLRAERAGELDLAMDAGRAGVGLFSQPSQSAMYLRSWRRRTVTFSSGHALRRAYMPIVIDVQAAERCQQELVRAGPAVGTSGGDGFIGDEAM